MTTKAQLRDVVAQILRGGATVAGSRIYTPGDWPTWEGEYPVALVSAPSENKESTGGRGIVEFTVVATIKIVAKTEIPAQVNQAGDEAAEAAIEAFQGQIESLVINNPAIVVPTSQTVSVRSKIAVTADGERPIAELVTEIDLEFYQGPEDFWDDYETNLTEVAINLDLQNRFDPSGIYADPPFPDAVVPAPRTAGPDGRDEASLLITLPTGD